MTLARMLSGLIEELRSNSPASAKAFRVAQRSAHALHVSPAISVERCVLVELTKPPAVMRGLHDLVVRRADERDVTGIAAVNASPTTLVTERMRNGDMAWVGELDGEIVCHTWFHPGPAPFAEERNIFALWALDATSFWSFDAVVKPEARTAGVFVKVFQTGLKDLFESHGATRVRGFIHDTNEPSLSVHKRMGWSILGTVTAVGLPGVKWLRWENGGDKRQWILPRGSDFALPPG